ncbi:hypothetical protein T459_31999 [Capsicum annuum]|uniref:Uncharacterized protein n=1 Tax=Capsicum annuum TaxID=4072 RepID=A0A2G2Y2Y2_CAPAN|nr:hypothetical protein T459_31999 [Capsicum annuum]
MKKLKEAASSRSKKSGSKTVSKKEFDDSGRLRLPKDEHIADKEEGRAEEFKIQQSLDMKDLPDDIDGTITESVQDAVDTLLFDLSTPSTTNTLDVGTPNIVTESQWMPPNSQFPPDFSDARVRENEATKTPVKRDRKKSRIFRSPYITKFGSISKDEDNFDNKKKQMYSFDGCTIYQELTNQLIIDYS